MASIKILNVGDAKQVIQNFKSVLHSKSLFYNDLIKPRTKDENAGITRSVIAFINSCMREYGEVITGSALEIARNEIDLRDAYLFYNAEEGGAGESAQNEAYDRFSSQMEMLCDAMGTIIEELPKDDVTRATKKDYERLRSNLMKLIRRREKLGLDMSKYRLGIPKKITDASARQIQRTINKIKDDFRYLGGGRYRGVKRK